LLKYNRKLCGLKTTVYGLVCSLVLATYVLILSTYLLTWLHDELSLLLCTTYYYLLFFKRDWVTRYPVSLNVTMIQLNPNNYTSTLSEYFLHLQHIWSTLYFANSIQCAVYTHYVHHIGRFFVTICMKLISTHFSYPCIHISNLFYLKLLLGMITIYMVGPIPPLFDQSWE